MTITPDRLMRTYDNKFTMPEWWRKATVAQKSRNKDVLLSQFVKRGDLVFDIGANRGMMTLVFRWLGARVVAVEPLFSAAPNLVREFGWRFNRDGDVTAVPKALSDKIGSTVISVHKNLPYLSSCDRPWMSESAHAKMYPEKAIVRRRVYTTTLDQLIAQHGKPAFIKLDVEGFESTVIRGLSSKIQCMNFEFHEDWLHDARQVMQHLDLLGKYEYNYVLDFRGHLELDNWLPARDGLLEHLRRTLTKSGKGSWGDIYARLIQ